MTNDNEIGLRTVKLYRWGSQRDRKVSVALTPEVDARRSEWRNGRAYFSCYPQIPGIDLPVTVVASEDTDIQAGNTVFLCASPAMEIQAQFAN
jgi:hypothetical protein